MRNQTKMKSSTFFFPTSQTSAGNSAIHNGKTLKYLWNVGYAYCNQGPFFSDFPLTAFSKPTQKVEERFINPG